MFRRLRAAVILALAWGVAWAAIGTPLNLLAAMILGGGSLRGYLAAVPLVALCYGAFGAFCGACFASVTMFAERERALQELSIRRLAVWGGLGGALLPLLSLGVVVLSGGNVFGTQVNVLPLLGVIATSGALGAAFASGQLRIARALPGSAESPRLKHESVS